jgi:hypothetical protein
MGIKFMRFEPVPDTPFKTFLHRLSVLRLVV